MFYILISFHLCGSTFLNTISSSVCFKKLLLLMINLKCSISIVVFFYYLSLTKLVSPSYVSIKVYIYLYNYVCVIVFFRSVCVCLIWWALWNQGSYLWHLQCPRLYLINWINTICQILWRTPCDWVLGVFIFIFG